MTDHKQRLNNKQDFEIGSAAASGDQGKYTNMLASLGLRLRQHCQFLTLT